jgi:hypothetical protein
MKRLLLVVALGLVSLASPQIGDLSHDVTPAPAAQEDPARVTVYITKTGEKYQPWMSLFVAQQNCDNSQGWRRERAMDRAVCISPKAQNIGSTHSLPNRPTSV